MKSEVKNIQISSKSNTNTSNSTHPTVFLQVQEKKNSACFKFKGLYAINFRTIHTNRDTHACTHTHMHERMHVHTHTHTHTHTHALTHTHTPSCTYLLWGNSKSFHPDIHLVTAIDKGHHKHHSCQQKDEERKQCSLNVVFTFLTHNSHC